jgi:protein FAM50
MSSSTSASNFSRPSAGSHTVEGNKSGSRAAALEAERQQANEDFERKKQAAADQRSKTTLSFKSTAASKGSAAEQTFRAKTVGLVTADDFLKLQQEASRQEDLLADELTLLEQQQKLDEMARHPKEDKKARKKRKKEKKKLLSTLSFGDEIAAEDDAEENEETAVPTKKKSKSSLKDPTVDTSFLPDQQRDNAERAERIRLTREWKEAQKSQRETPLQVTYSYWDGTGHRKTVVTKQGNSISEFLQLVLDDLIPSFRQLAGLTADDLMYVKEGMYEDTVCGDATAIFNNSNDFVC